MDRGLTAEAAAHLQDGINLLLSRWTALRMTVENEWGGRDSSQKAQQLGQQLCYLLTQSKEQVYIEDLEDLLEDSILSLNTVIDDGSIEEVAEKLLVMHEECVQARE
ncbi:pre-rRNA-processing protein TSR2-like isoform X2 [Andrographis paniculata]|uniref:pre-rRNA-processing protein TSR2-like isoform X2 n=1 Tax=Andrographis paniculata TaxID=175694 RepID=UPI0021E6FA57|nr:pre-rRNA-processing protein TSR2-like isoform X2 [Andrographis paniculata]